MFPVERLPLAEAYAEHLASAGVVRGLIGPRETPRLWDRHLLNSAVLAQVVPDGASVADVGSGAGLPGIPLAIARPDLRVVLIEPLLRRATFLTEVVDALGLDNVEVLRGRAEELHRSADLAPGFDVVTSRAVAGLGQLVDWCMPLVHAHGVLLGLKGSSVRDELDGARRTLTSWGCSEPEVVELGADLLTESTFAVRIAWSDPTSVGWPARRVPARSKDRRRRRT
ncbi:MAG: rRNA m(7)G-527 methyltransferase [Nocardioides sp.]|nr:rRNA m(7)G-527 methyltransferase [Nocardioides sp.]